MRVIRVAAPKWTDPNHKAFDQMIQRLTDFATEAKCTGAANGCSNDDFVRKSSERVAEFDPGRFVMGLPFIGDGPNRQKPPEEIFRTSGLADPGWLRMLRGLCRFVPVR